MTDCSLVTPSLDIHRCTQNSIWSLGPGSSWGGWGWEPHPSLALGGTRRDDEVDRDFSESFLMP